MSESSTLGGLQAQSSCPFVLNPHALTSHIWRGLYKRANSTVIVRELVTTLHDAGVKFDNVTTLISSCHELHSSRGFCWIFTHLRSKLILRSIESNHKATAATVTIRVELVTQTFRDGVIRVLILGQWINFFCMDWHGHQSSGLLISARLRGRKLKKIGIRVGYISGALYQRSAFELFRSR